MKSKVITGGVVVLIFAVVAGNWIYGKNIAKDIDEDLKEKIANKELPVDISYASVVVNPLFSNVKLADFEISNPDKSISLKSDEIEFDIPVKEALRLAESTTFDELNSIKIQFKKAELVTETKGEITVKNVTFDFDGHLTNADINQFFEEFPTEKQAFEFSFTGLKVNNLVKPDQNTAAAKLQEQFSSIDKGTCKILFDPESKEIELDHLLLSSEVLSTSSKAIFYYSGNGASDFKMLNTKIKADYTVKPKDIHWDQDGNSSDFSLKQLSVKSDFTMNLEKPSLPEGTISFLAEGLKSNSTGQSAISLPFPGASFDEVDIRKFSINYKLNNDRLTLSDTELISSIINAEFNADITIDRDNTKNSKINNAKLVVNNLSSELEGIVSLFEGKMGKELPRENNKITLEITGSLSSPKVKGIEF